MTVLFAFASPQHDTCFIAGDNREGHYGKTVDKVTLSWKRYAIGIAGHDTAKTALLYAGAFDVEADERYYASGQCVSRPS